MLKKYWPLVLLFISIPLVVYADIGFYLKSDCTTIRSPQIGQTWCFDSTAKAIKVWDGSTYVTTYVTVPVLASEGGTGLDTSALTGVPTLDLGTWTIEDPLAVDKGGTGATTLTDGGLLLGSGTGAITALGVAANGQIPIGDGTTDPVLGTISGTASEVEVTNGPGTIQVGIVDPLAASKGGSGLDTSASTGTARVDAGTWSVDDLNLESSTTAGLGVAGTAGRMKRVTDEALPIWFDDGSAWLPAGSHAVIGTNNVGMGLDALASLTAGAHSNVAIGRNAMQSTTDGHSNVAIGLDALKLQVGLDTPPTSNESNSNVAIGTRAMDASINSYQNVAIGSDALGSIVTKHRNNTAIGWSSLKNAVGNQAVGEANHNVGIGHSALEFCSTCFENTAVGALAMAGASSFGYNHTGTDNVGIGLKAFQGAGDTGANQNTAIGSEAMAQHRNSSTSVAVGFRALLGQLSAGVPISGASANTVIGANAMPSATSGGQNTVVGEGSFAQLTTGTQNVSLGQANGADSITTGSRNIFIGWNAGKAAAAGTSDKLYIATNSSETPYIFGDMAAAPSPFVEFNGRMMTDAGTLTLGVGVTTFAPTRNVMTITGDAGANTISTITGARDGMILTMIFTDSLITISNDDTHAADTVDLTGAANFTSADDTVLQLVYDGTSWYQIASSIN